MTQINSVSLIGLGAIGASYGSRFHDFLGDSFQVVAEPARIKKYKEQGISVNGKEYHFNYIAPDENTNPADLVIIAVKNAQLKEAIDNIQNHIGPDTIILSLLNGISSEEEIAAATGNEHLLYSMCVEIAAKKVNRDVHYSNIGRICFGERDKTISDDVLAVKELFENANIPYEVSEDIWHTIWAKFMFNVGINQTSAVLRSPYRVFQQIPAAHEWMEKAMYEVVAISEKVGVNLTEKDVQLYRPVLERLDPEGQTSMLQDILLERKTEVEHFAGKVCELGRKFNVPTPVNDQLFKMIHIMEEMARTENRPVY